MAASIFDVRTAPREFESAGGERWQAKAIAEGMRRAAGADRAELVTGGELHRALWIQGAGIVAILAALRFLPV